MLTDEELRAIRQRAESGDGGRWVREDVGRLLDEVERLRGRFVQIEREVASIDTGGLEPAASFKLRALAEIERLKAKAGETTIRISATWQGETQQLFDGPLLPWPPRPRSGP